MEIWRLFVVVVVTQPYSSKSLETQSKATVTHGLAGVGWLVFSKVLPRVGVSQRSLHHVLCFRFSALDMAGILFPQILFNWKKGEAKSVGTREHRAERPRWPPCPHSTDSWQEQVPLQLLWQLLVTEFAGPQPANALCHFEECLQLHVWVRGCSFKWVAVYTPNLFCKLK